jgi:hypothetical protein
MTYRAGEDHAGSGGEEDVPQVLGYGGEEHSRLTRETARCTMP